MEKRIQIEIPSEWKERIEGDHYVEMSVFKSNEGKLWCGMALCNKNGTAVERKEYSPEEKELRLISALRKVLDESYETLDEEGNGIMAIDDGVISDIEQLLREDKDETGA